MFKHLSCLLFLWLLLFYYFSNIWIIQRPTKNKDLTQSPLIVPSRKHKCGYAATHMHHLAVSCAYLPRGVLNPNLIWSNQIKEDILTECRSLVSPGFHRVIYWTKIRWTSVPLVLLPGLCNEKLQNAQLYGWHTRTSKSLGKVKTTAC